MKSSALIAIVAAGALSASAAACPAYQQGQPAGGSSHPAVRALLHSAATTTCTPRMYWFPAQCSSDRSVTAAARATQSTKGHVAGTSVETCLPRIYWFLAHCQ